MANIITPGSFHPLRVNQYVAKMQYASDVNYSGSTRINFGAVPATGTVFLNVANAATGSPADLSSVIITVPWGRSIQVVGNATMGTAGLTVRGYDYLGAPMAEAFTMNGITTVLGNRAFKFLTNVTWAAVAGGTFTLALGPKLGLPYAALAARLETAGGVPTATQGTLTPRTTSALGTGAGAADSRGTYTPFTTAGGSVITVMVDFANDTFGTIPNDVGGLHGFPQAFF